MRWSTAKFFTCASTLAVISLICLLESWLQISSCSFTYSSRSSCSFLAFSSFVLQKTEKINNFGSLRDETSQPPLWATKRITYCSSLEWLTFAERHDQQSDPQGPPPFSWFSTHWLHEIQTWSGWLTWRYTPVMTDISTFIHDQLPSANNFFCEKIKWQINCVHHFNLKFTFKVLKLQLTSRESFNMNGTTYKLRIAL